MVKWDDYGESSLTLLAVYCRMDKKKPYIPYDPSYFQRCIHLFECLELGKGEIFSLLYETADKYPEWRIFADNWNILTDLYLEEKNKNSGHKLYEAMFNLRKFNETETNTHIS